MFLWFDILIISFTLQSSNRSRRKYTMKETVQMMQSRAISILEAVCATKFCVTRQALKREIERLGEVIPKEITPTADIGM